MNPLQNSLITGTHSESGSVSKNNKSPEKLKNDFITLMTAQLKNQDPSSPVKSDQFIGQLAQFSQVESLEKMSFGQQKQIDSINNLNRLESTTLIGKQALIPANSFDLNDSGISGKIQLSSAGSVKIGLYNDNGGMVKEINMGNLPKGSHELNFVPSKLNIPNGHYHIQVSAINNKQNVPSETFFRGSIEKVFFNDGQNCTTANISNGLGLTSISKISEISKGL